MLGVAQAALRHRHGGLPGPGSPQVVGLAEPGGQSRGPGQLGVEQGPLAHLDQVRQPPQKRPQHQLVVARPLPERHHLLGADQSQLDVGRPPAQHPGGTEGGGQRLGAVDAPGGEGGLGGQAVTALVLVLVREVQGLGQLGQHPGPRSDRSESVRATGVLLFVIPARNTSRLTPVAHQLVEPLRRPTPLHGTSPSATWAIGVPASMRRHNSSRPCAVRGRYGDLRGPPGW